MNTYLSLLFNCSAPCPSLAPPPPSYTNFIQIIKLMAQEREGEKQTIQTRKRLRCLMQTTLYWEVADVKSEFSGLYKILNTRLVFYNLFFFFYHVKSPSLFLFKKDEKKIRKRLRCLNYVTWCQLTWQAGQCDTEFVLFCNSK